MASFDLFSGVGCKALVYRQKLKKAVNLPTDCEFTEKCVFLEGSSCSVGCTDARECIFYTCLPPSWQCMQSLTDESHPLTKVIESE